MEMCKTVCLCKIYKCIFFMPLYIIQGPNERGTENISYKLLSVIQSKRQWSGDSGSFPGVWKR